MMRVLAFVLLATSVFASADDPPNNDPAHVLVVGRVKAPGAIDGLNDLTLTKALEKVGGYIDFADRRHILIWRNAEKKWVWANESAIRRKEQIDLPLRNGDVVIVAGRRMSL